MCFSPEADLVGGVVVGAIGVDVLRHVGKRREILALAWLPVLLAVHQIDESFVWWGLRGDVAESIGHAATWVYLVFAFVVLPVYVPMAVMLREPQGSRRTAMVGFIVLGAGVAAILLGALLVGPVEAELRRYHLAYSSGIGAGLLITAAYVVATCGSLVLSRSREVAVFGVVNLAAVAILALIDLDGFASLWCAWAAITSGAIAWHVRRTLVAARSTPSPQAPWPSPA